MADLADLADLAVAAEDQDGLAEDGLAEDGAVSAARGIAWREEATVPLSDSRGPTVLIQAIGPTLNVRVKMDGRAERDELHRVLERVLAPFVVDVLANAGIPLKDLHEFQDIIAEDETDQKKIGNEVSRWENSRDQRDLE